jgi:CPA2 family monovalent cation:H+ antiporter-2
LIFVAETIVPLTTVGIILGFSLVLSIVVKRLGQNPVLGFILSGFLLGPFALGFLNPKDILVESFSELGLFVLLFYLGIELSFKDFIKSGVPTLGLALVDMVALAVVGFAVSTFFGFSFTFSAAIALMMLSTSSAIVGKFMIDKGLMKNASAQMSMAILILQDFIGIMLLVFISSLSNSGSAIGLGLTALVFAVVSFYGVHRFSGVVEKFFDEHGFSSTELTLYALCIGLIVATLGSFLGLSPALGAYFAGFALSEFKAGEKVKKQIDFLRDFFILFFFVAFGASLFFNSELGKVAVPDPSHILFIAGFALLLSVLSIIMHAISLTIFGPVFSLTNRASSEIAIFLTPLGEFVIIISIAVLPLLGAAEASTLTATAFLLILMTLFMFQPLYKRIDLHEKLTALLPALAPKVKTEKPLVQHNPESLKYLHDFGINLILLLCLIWITPMLFVAIPDLGIPIPYGRAIVTGALFAFLALLPMARCARAFRKLWNISAYGFAK